MNSCRVCLSFVTNVSDISKKSYNGRNLLSVFNELVNIFNESPYYLCPMCERGLTFTYDFRKKALKSTQFFETEIKIELPDICDQDSLITSVTIFEKDTKKENSHVFEQVVGQKPKGLNESSHVLQERYLCRYCLKQFSIRTALKLHESNHVIQNGGLECHFCQKFFRRQELINHIKHVHLRDIGRRYYCDKCHKNFSAFSTLSTHKKRCHSSIKKINFFNCYYCDKKYQEKDFLRRHIRNVHIVFKACCHYCEKWFKSKTILKAHIQGVHINIKSFLCEICKTSFSTAASRINHMRSHTQHMSFHCIECDLSFKTNSNLKRHRINRHSNTFRYTCPTCIIKFKTSTGLKLHQSRHNPPEFRCDICGKSFTRNQGLKEHVYAIHLGRKLFCQECKQEFSRRDALLKHVKVFHHIGTF